MPISSPALGRTFLAVGLLASSCAAAPPAAEIPDELFASAGFVACESPRPEMCTHEYRPVCAARDTGVRCVTTPCPSVEWQTYGNACTACSDAKVEGHRPGECATH